ncbi:phenylacetate-CoA oxygenase subunit PaaI [Tistrella bauzanensis]|jgi:ring-1,2-phenylacetyl-CoA epoxidase subunit PaaA|uniref:Phenylacetic acid catabolic protein n=1 Tax=Tistrella arctica TaxID=3133430 RepID=A0ABU9YSW2_9PROT
MLENVAMAPEAEAPVVVNGPEEFYKMPKEYQDLVIHQLRAHTEGELTGADDYTQLLYPMAPDAYERKMCCERAAEEMDHFVRGAEVLRDLGIDVTYMMDQHFQERQHYRTDAVRKIDSWVQRGLFSMIGEGAVLAMIEEMAQSSYKPIANMCISIVMDEYNHVAQGRRIVKQLCATPEGRAAVQAELEGVWWSTMLDLFGRSESERSKAYVKWGLRKYTNEEARQRYCAHIVPQLRELGLDVPDDWTRGRKFL